MYKLTIPGEPVAKGRIINCFAYREDQCPFYKTRAEYKKGNKDGWAEFPRESED